MQIFNTVAIFAAMAGSASAFTPVQPKSSFTGLNMLAPKDKWVPPGQGAPAAPAWAAPAAPAAAPTWAPPDAAAPAPQTWAAPAAAAPPAAAGGGGDVVGTLAGLEGPGQVWGADGIAVGKEESDLKGYDNFGIFVERLQSTGVAAELAGPGPFTVFAPTDTAVQSHENMIGAFDAAACRLHIVPGNVPSVSVGSADLTTIGGVPLVYKRAFRKDFVNDVIVGEKTFGQFSDFPTDVACSNGVIHTVGISCAASM